MLRYNWKPAAVRRICTVLYICMNSDYSKHPTLPHEHCWSHQSFWLLSKVSDTQRLLSSESCVRPRCCLVSASHSLTLKSFHVSTERKTEVYTICSESYQHNKKHIQLLSSCILYIPLAQWYCHEYSLSSKAYFV